MRRGKRLDLEWLKGCVLGIEELRSGELTRVLQLVQGASVSNQSSYSKTDGKGRREI